MTMMLAQRMPVRTEIAATLPSPAMTTMPALQTTAMLPMDACMLP